MNSGLLLLCALGLFLISTTALAGPNPNFRLPLHVVESFWAPCEDYLPVDCLGTRPATAAIPNHPAVIYLLVFNHTGIAGLQAGLEWDPSWTWSFALFDCLPGQLEGIFPDGPTTASGSTAFNCLQGPALAAIGRITFQVGHSGCLKFRQPAYTLGIAALACTSQEVDQITDADSPRLGRVCVGSGGHDPCDAAVPVEPSTWGEIKSTFR